MMLPVVEDLKVLLVPVVPVGVSPLTVAEEGTSSSPRGSELSAEETPSEYDVHVCIKYV